MAKPLTMQVNSGNGNLFVLLDDGSVYYSQFLGDRWHAMKPVPTTYADTDADYEA